jgi:hypothetical protein
MKNWFPVLALFVGLGCSISFAQAEQEHQFSGPFDLYMKAEQQRSPDSVLRRFAADCGLDLQAALPHYAVLPGKNWVIVKDLEKGFEFQETDFISTTAVRKLGDLVVVETWSLELDTGSQSRSLYCFKNLKTTLLESTDWMPSYDKDGIPTPGWGYEQRWRLSPARKLVRYYANFIDAAGQSIAEPKMDAETTKDLQWTPGVYAWNDLTLPLALLR